MRPPVAYAVIGLTALAPAMGGSTELWAQGALAIGTGLLLTLAPPRRSLGLVPNLGFVALFLIALTAFLPMSWFNPPDWWIDMSRLGAQLPGTRSPQPWLTLQWTGLLLLALVWMYYLATFEWSRRVRDNACVVFGIAILALAAALTLSFILTFRIPFWPDTTELGFFPNRNQTGNVLGLGGVMIYALGLQRFHEDRKYWWLWLASLPLLCWALILNYSRAGIILFFLGALAVHIYWWSATKERRRPLVAFGGLALLIALFIINGGATLVRFGKETAGFFSPPQNLRLSIFRDAISLIEKSPLLGSGLGNFRGLFALNRNYSANISQAVHPESDWLWAAADVGLIGLLLGLVLFFWWLRQCPPFGARTNRLLRVAAMVCGIAFAIHGVFDVSGHRPGAVWPAIFLASIAMHPENKYRRSTAVSVIFRVIGVLLIAIGSWWMASAFGARTPPTSATVERLRPQIEAALAAEDFNKVTKMTSDALVIGPLDWEFYFKRGVAEAGSFQPGSEVDRDFAIARYLLPNLPDLYLKEGQVLLTVGEPDLAFNVWREGMRRVPSEAASLYGQIFGLIRGDVALIDRWRQLAKTNKECLLIFFQNAGPFEFQIELQRLLSDDPKLASFSAAELAPLFSSWYQKGDKFDLARTLEEHPEWRKIGWRELARAYADREDYRRAYETAQQFSPQPELPQSGSPQPLDKARARFLVNRTNLDAGLDVYFAQIREGDIDNALGTVRELVALPNSPKYLSYFEAQLWAQRKDWQRAWQALARFALGKG